MTFAERVQSILDQTQLTPPKLATYVGLKWPKTIYDALSGKSDTFAPHTITRFAKAFSNLNTQWLACGQGDMTTDGKPIVANYTDIIADGLRERALDICRALKINKATFTRRCDLAAGSIDKLSSNSYISTIDRICAAFPMINRQWLISGEGEMFVDEYSASTFNNPMVSAVNSAVVTGNGNAFNYQGGASESASTRSYAPLIPQFVKNTPNLDVLHYARENQCPACPISIEGIHVDLWYSVEDSAMAPNFRLGDSLALVADVDTIIPGKVYVIDTNSQGCIFRMFLLNDHGDFVCRSTNQELYPDFVISQSDVIRIYKVAVMFRFNTNL